MKLKITQHFITQTLSFFQAHKFTYGVRKFGFFLFNRPTQIFSGVDPDNLDVLGPFNPNSLGPPRFGGCPPNRSRTVKTTINQLSDATDIPADDLIKLGTCTLEKYQAFMKANPSYA